MDHFIQKLKGTPSLSIHYTRDDKDSKWLTEVLVCAYVQQ